MLPMHARHFLSGRGRPSSSAIQSNNCFITGPSRKSFVASIALACSGGKSVSRGGIYLFFLPDSFRDVLSLSIYHCSQKLQPSSHNSVFHLAGSPKSVFCSVFGKGKSQRKVTAVILTSQQMQLCLWQCLSKGNKKP